MRNPTVYIHIGNRNQDSPVARTVGAASKAAHATIVDSPVNDQATEADIAVVDSVETALRIAKETKRTKVFLAYLVISQEREARALAARFPERITATSFVRRPGEESLIAALMRTITRCKTIYSA